MIHVLEKMVNRNQLGIKTGRGFYDYPGKTGLPFKDILVTGKKGPSRQEVKDRLWECYMRSVASVIESRLCSREELAGYLKDYLGTDNDPFAMIGN
jgi:3-hydroxyacyl-CoA dehydrogenase